MDDRPAEGRALTGSLAARSTSDERHCSLDDLLAAIAPGETVTYEELLGRLRRIGRSTVGVGAALTPYREGNMLALPSGERQPNGELHAWMGGRFWDSEVEGSWAPETLMIARRPES